MNAVAVVDQLRHAGFDAYLVGGCVRDLLLGRTPKDFDVATSATPEDVRGALPRVRIVGRRFRLAHVRMRRETIEVSTFRGAPSRDARAGTGASFARRASDGRGIADGEVSEDGLILRDNAYGSIDEDAFRRDFTINALYYDPQADIVLDYCRGMADVEARTLRVIGDPDERFREDPVRILRALRFAAKLDLALHPRTEAAIAPTADLLAAIAPARLFDEFSKMFLHGHGQRTFELLREHGLTETLLPAAAADDVMARIAVANTDERVAAGKPVTPGFLLAAFLWREYLARTVPFGAGKRRRLPDLDEAASAAMRAQRAMAVPRRHGWFARDVWTLQPRFERRTPKNVTALLEHRRFRAAYDFLMLRVQSGEAPAQLGAWWTDVQVDGEALVAALADVGPGDSEDVGFDAESSPAAVANGSAPPRKRRRRRRRRARANMARLPAGEGGAVAAAPGV